MSCRNDILLGSAHPAPDAFGGMLPPLQAEAVPPAAPVAGQRSVYTNPTLKAGKLPYPHRFHLVDGRVLEGDMYREPNSRLVDDLYGTKGEFICVVNAQPVGGAGGLVPFMVVNLHHLVCIEEL